MELKINVNKKIIVNGKEYTSVEEMPAGIREAYKKVTEGSSFTFTNVGAVKRNNKIIFNGKEYDNEGVMPLEERVLYNDLMKALGDTFSSSKGDNTKDITTTRNIDSQSTIGNIKPIVPKASISIRQFIIGATILAFIALLLYVLNIIGNR